MSPPFLFLKWKDVEDWIIGINGIRHEVCAKSLAKDRFHRFSFLSGPLPE